MPSGDLTQEEDPGPNAITPDFVAPPPILGQWIVSISAGTDAAGQPDVFVETTAGNIARYSTASGWQVLPPGGDAQSFSATASERVYSALSDTSVNYSDDAAGWTTLPSA